MLAILTDNGYLLTDKEEEADIYIVNTCAFIADAKKESIDAILHLSSYKKENPRKKLIVTGCLSERYRDEFFEAIPEADKIIGISSWDKIVSLLKSSKRESFDEKDRLPLYPKRIATGSPFTSYLKISEGCSKNCSYCIIPSIRGPYRSVPMEILLKEAEALSESGVKELILVAQETTIYGVDLYHKRMLPTLLRKLSRIKGIRWIRILYAYPEEITKELISVIKKSKKIVPYLDIPIQHASDRILSLMNRHMTKKELTDKIKYIRKEIPGIALRTTLITGFPTETEDDFKELLSFIRKMRFEHLGVFAYSEEEGTKSSHMKPKVPVGIRKKRRDILMKEQQKILLSQNKKKMHQVFDLIVEGRLTEEDNIYVCRTSLDSPDVDGYFFLHSEKELMSGDLVRGKVTGYKVYDLVGELVL